MKPIAAHIELTYECHKCGNIHFVGIDEVKFPGHRQCSCGEVLVFTPFKEAKFVAKMGKLSRGRQPIVSDKDAVISMIESYGYTNEKASLAVDRALELFDCKSVSELLKESLGLL